MDQTVTEPEPAWHTAPWLFGFCSASGLHTGVLTVLLPYLASHQGMSLTMIAAIIGAGMLPVSLKVVFTPLIDLVWTMRAWVIAGMTATALFTAALVLIPFEPRFVPVLAALAFAGGCASQVAAIAVYGLLALTTERRRLGAASGFLQGGALVVQGFGGAAGLWLATHVGIGAAALAVSVVCAFPALAMRAIAEPVRPHLDHAFAPRVRSIGADLLELVRGSRSRYVLLSFLTPIGVGGASYTWAGLARDWHAGADLVAMVSGAGAALASAAGALVYVRFADRFERVPVFLLTGVILLIPAAALAIAARTPVTFTIGTLCYALCLGFSYTAFSALMFETVGKGAAASKACVLNAAGNVPVSYMPVVLGVVHDRSSTSAMLWFEVAITLATVALFWALRPRKPALGSGIILAPA